MLVADRGGSSHLGIFVCCHIFVMTDFFSGGEGGAGAWSAGQFLDYGSLKRHLLHFEGTLEQNIKVLNVIFLQRTSSF